MAQLLTSCREAARLISKQHDTTLSGPARIRLWVHLAVCAHCRRYSHQIELLKSLVRGYPERLSRAKLPKETHAEIVRQLAQQL